MAGVTFTAWVLVSSVSVVGAPGEFIVKADCERVRVGIVETGGKAKCVGIKPMTQEEMAGWDRAREQLAKSLFPPAKGCMPLDRWTGGCKEEEEQAKRATPP